MRAGMINMIDTFRSTVANCRIALRLSVAALCIMCACVLSACAIGPEDDAVILRICNWEEYIDEGGWDEDEIIELDNGSTVYGENNIIEDYENWYYEKYGVRVRVEYSCFGTNEELYNQLTIGDRFDLVCPSDYMIMKLMTENKLEPYSDEFYNENNEDNCYVRGVSPYIKRVFDDNEINGEAWSRYAAGYMWGTTGLVYNPEEITAEQAADWSILMNPDYNRRMTIKDNVRDSYFTALAIYKKNKLLGEEFLNRSDYTTALAHEMNDTSDDTIAAVEDILREIKDNVYSFETDSGKADMVSGKVLANYQWSGDGVYTIEQAAEDGVKLCYEVAEQCSNLWFDGWVMLKDGISEDVRRKQAAEAFVNYMSMPVNAVRNMYYIGYTSVIAGTEDDSTIFDYVNWNYAAEDESEELIDYDISYFFQGEDKADGSYTVQAESGAELGALGAQYPTLDTIRKCAVMNCFDDETNEKINQMWINVRCFKI